jgi:internalin A
LDLNGNKIVNVDSLCNLPLLTYLDLRYNEITDIDSLCNLTSLTYLDLSYNKITDIDSLCNLTLLTSLYLRNNQIVNISSLYNLPLLTYLDLRYNEITDINSLSNLTSLACLYLNNNEILDISSLSNLTSLSSLYLHHNKIRDINCLSKLIYLNSLDLSTNQITDISSLSQLTSLTSLFLYSNQITDLSQLEILCNLPVLERVFISKNPIPVESGLKLDNLEILRAYFKDRNKGLSTHRHLKLLFLGDGCAGKSTLFSHLRDGKATEIDMNERTDGVTLTCWENALPEVTVNVWDFGGQDVFHGTHRLFLGERAIYVLVYTKDIHKKCSKEEKHPLRYWLDFIADFGKNSFVFLVENIMDNDYTKNEEFPDDFTFEELCKEYESQNIQVDKNQYRIDCKYDTDAVDGFKAILQARIISMLNKYPVDGHPKNWHEVQQLLEEKKKKQQTISMADYEEICQQYDIASSQALLGFFHNNGTVSYYRDLYQDKIILQTQWVLNAIYAVVSIKENNPLKSKNGKLSDDDFAGIWTKYNVSDRKLFISYMLKSGLMAEPFKYSWKNKLKRNYQYLFPALFETVKSHDKIFWEKEDSYYSVIFRFVYQAIIHRLQVAILSHCHAEEEETFYKNFIKFTDSNNKVGYIEMIEADKELKIWAETKDLYAKIFTELNKIYPLDRVTINKYQREKSKVNIDFTPDKIDDIILKDGFTNYNKIMPTLNFIKDGNYWNLVEEIKAKKVVLFAGTGVSAYTTDGNKVSMWQGLIKDGIEYCNNFSIPGCDDKWVKRKIEGIDNGDLDEWLSIAEELTKKLNSKGHLKPWLEKSVGSLQPIKKDLIEEIGKLNCPIFTTNYDNLLRYVLKKDYIVNFQDDKIHEVVKGKRDALVYLHGHYDEEKSVIFGIASYEQLNNNVLFQTLEKVISLNHHILFVGYGAGFNDPNFGRLMEWSNNYVTSSHHHYRLVLEKDKNIDSGDNKIQNIVYSNRNDYDDIVTFFEELNKDVKLP